MDSRTNSILQAVCHWNNPQEFSRLQTTHSNSSVFLGMRIVNQNLQGSLESSESNMHKWEVQFRKFTQNRKKFYATRIFSDGVHLQTILSSKAPYTKSCVFDIVCIRSLLYWIIIFWTGQNRGLSDIGLFHLHWYGKSFHPGSGLVGSELLS